MRRRVKVVEAEPSGLVLPAEFLSREDPVWSSRESVAAWCDEQGVKHLPPNTSSWDPVEYLLYAAQEWAVEHGVTVRGRPTWADLSAMRAAGLDVDKDWWLYKVEVENA